MTQLIHIFPDLSHKPDSLTHVDRLTKTTGRVGVITASPALTNNEQVRFDMATDSVNAWNLSAQDTPIDPLIIFARVVNDAAMIERNLANRRALRPARSEAARLGWRSRRGI